jgi:hypothetical protein
LQERRAAERGRGRKARAPLQIPLRGWKDIFVRTYYEILADRLLAVAAGIAFYSLVALFPALASGPRCPGLHCRHRGAAADPGPLIRRPLLEIRAVKSSILERNVLRIGDVFAL